MPSPTTLWNQAMIDRYDLAGPRYTSYPTAPHFAEGFPASEVQAAIARSNASQRPLSLYFHIPFCDTICFYCGCNKIVTANKGRAEPYIDLLHRELALRARQFDRARPVRQLHWGGGTPTFLSAPQMRTLMRLTGEYFSLLGDDSGDYSIEVHPGRMAPDTLGVLREIGFNRLSMGVQDFDPRVQRAVNRFNSVEQVSELCQRARREGFRSLSMDLIYGLPHQNPDTMAATLEQVIALEPDRLSLFNYAHMPHLFKSQRHIDAGALPPPADKLAMVHHAIDRLQAAGYQHIGMDHFARPGDSLALAQARGEMQRNFQGYTTHGDCDLLAFGLSAISAIDNVYLQNHKDMVRYAQSLAVDGEPACKGLALSADDRLRRAVIGQLICHFHLDYAAFERDFGIDFKRYFATALASLRPLARDGLLRLDSGGITVSAGGRLLIRRICMAFDAYLGSQEPARYSRIL
ncbi:oxygen-independent coproporphyrinogen III oxidase [Parahaliea mediterranea]|uniref:Coproporphyrinogen-III oxidase n=1 Tax=Parahaliea mediterranea TaxID=651086 RepID=A0A939DJL4_9GAMM|nr:oxygen-independent coproporphyrinogen III oxidase [Parahaliea mediterranea]MBN7798712.1 oxygen-independent coproporphyrinogen III oxidase [Parahaliea mediterranea]